MFLPSIKTFVYTIQRNVERQQKMAAMLNKLGFSNWEFVVGSIEKNPYWMNIHVDFAKVLETPPPFLFLEDDVDLTEYYRPEITYPNDAELVYLGGSVNGELYHIRDITKLARENNETLMMCTAPREFWPEFMIYAERPDSWIRTYNMHSTHAILFVGSCATNGMRDFIRENSQLGLGRLPAMQSMAVDRLFGDQMHLYKTYCLKRPFWYQNDGRNNRITFRYYEGEPITPCNIFDKRLLKYACYAKGEDGHPISGGIVYKYTEFVEVTDRLNSLIKMGLMTGERLWNELIVSNDVTDCDPFPGCRKVLYVEYNSGATACWDEGKTFFI
jgi:hypothetical protein